MAALSPSCPPPRGGVAPGPSMDPPRCGLFTPPHTHTPLHPLTSSACSGWRSAHFPPAPKRVPSPPTTGPQGMLEVPKPTRQGADSASEGPLQKHTMGGGDLGGEGAGPTPAGESKACWEPWTHQDTFPHNEEGRPAEDEPQVKGQVGRETETSRPTPGTRLPPPGGPTSQPSLCTRTPAPHPPAPAQPR